MKRVVIVQARMGSVRLPGKVLADLAGRPMLTQQLLRLARCARADEVVVATTTQAADDPVVSLARAAGVRWFRGSEQDVLSRYVGASRESAADLIVRVTADCPLIDPGEVDRVVGALEERPGEFDYASNVIRRTFPRGLDTEAFFRDTLERTGRLGVEPKAREHVTWFILRERPDLFLRRSIEDSENHSDLRWTVDTPEDLALARRVYSDLDLGNSPRAYREILAHVRAHPDISALNAAIAQKGA